MVMVKLSQAEIQRRTYLVQRFRTGYLEPDQAEELKQLLEKEKDELMSSDTKDLLLLLGVILLLGLVVAFLGNKKIDLETLNKSIDEFVWGKRKR
jgi:hypothetical protein